MNKMARGLSYLIAVGFEAVALIFGAAFVAKWLDGSYPKSFRWLSVTIPVAMVVIGHTFYVVLRAVIKMDRRDGQGGDGSSDVR